MTAHEILTLLDRLFAVPEDDPSAAITAVSVRRDHAWGFTFGHTRCFYASMQQYEPTPIDEKTRTRIAAFFRKAAAMAEKEGV